MSIPLTNIHKSRVVDQIVQNLIGLQNDMVRNAATWRAMAVAQSPPLATLQQFMHDAAASYQTRLGWVTTLRNDSVKLQRFIDEITLRGWTQADITDVLNPLITVANQLAGAGLATYAACITACDGITAAVDKPDSLWPE